MKQSTGITIVWYNLDELSDQRLAWQEAEPHAALPGLRVHSRRASAAKLK